MNFMKGISIGVFALVLFSCNAQVNGDQNSTKTEKVEKKSKMEVLEVSDYKSKLSKGVQLVDVRTPEEYSSGHIEGADNVNVLEKDFKGKMEKYSKDTPVYIYCRSGGRSGRAAKQLIADGFTEVYDLKGGILNWTASGESVSK